MQMYDSLDNTYITYEHDRNIIVSYQAKGMFSC